ncbi:TPA: hypothetical protein PP061_001751 [Salmonella bongori]|uniref:Uncharacterized protein n=1 Tax=Salmonella bongori N268-08 TaxID=1197719 RepID=S5MTT9_SALBN|nr:hypothetical protein [Salmonella bongori]AGR57998.1 hypothetical protein A464_812 [Salmonella bongori N268-08]EDP8574465.1 hypothetical protein [Salmonella bongori]EDP8593232.1 hypothetical protein [Salmonella bongori]EDP8598714.1 hypothetical protein [Salmonella bongori]EDP8629060.1 hypothetical protein [Salmonella bongori]
MTFRIMPHQRIVLPDVAYSTMQEERRDSVLIARFTGLSLDRANSLMP